MPSSAWAEYTSGMENPTGLVWSEHCHLHETHGHPENVQRLLAIERFLHERGLLDDHPAVEPCPATVEDVVQAHSVPYVNFIQQISGAGGGYLDADTYVSPGTWDAALWAAGAGISAVDAVIETPLRRAFAFVRPPGHHAEHDRGMGFCIFNNGAIAAYHALERHRLSRVAIIDWDVHHGNGTQSIFYDSDQVLFVSVHQWPLFPGTGQADEEGSGHGQGCTLNIPLPPGTGDAAYLHAFDQVIAPRVADFQPDLILVSAGFDAHRDDPLALMSVTERGFYEMATRVRTWADQYCDGRLVALLEGGYNLRALVRSVDATLRAFDGQPFASGATGG